MLPGPGSRLERCTRLFNKRESHCAKFRVQLGSATGTFRLVLSTESVNTLLKQLRLDQPQRKFAYGAFQCHPSRANSRLRRGGYRRTAWFESCGTRPDSLQPGSVLKLHAPIRNPGMLTAGGHGLLEAAPVRIGSQRAAQLGQWVRSMDRERR